MRLMLCALAVAGVFGTAAPALAQTAPAAPVADPYAPPPLTPENTWNLDLSTGGRVVIQLRPDRAPLAVERIRTLTERGFYNNTIFHRVIEGFMAQGGDPKGTGEGGSELPDLKAEFNSLPHVRGTLSMARATSDDSANSQFFIMLAPNLRLDGKYTAAGRVVSGMQYVDAIERGEPPANPTRILRATIGAAGDAPLPPQPAAAPAVTPPPSGPIAPPSSGALPSGQR